MCTLQVPSNTDISGYEIRGFYHRATSGGIRTRRILRCAHLNAAGTFPFPFFTELVQKRTLSQDVPEKNRAVVQAVAGHEIMVRLRATLQLH